MGEGLCSVFPRSSSTWRSRRGGVGRSTSANSVTQHPRPSTQHTPAQVGGSGVLVQPMTYIFDEEPPRWRQLLANLGVDPASVDL